MPLPDWMTGWRTTTTSGRKPDVWNGKPLPARNVTHTNINYRMYDRRTGEILSFNSTNSIDSIVTDVLRTQKEHPNAQLMAVEYDGPAWPDQ